MFHNIYINHMQFAIIYFSFWIVFEHLKWNIHPILIQLWIIAL